jgi:hypothetical protein
VGSIVDPPGTSLGPPTANAAPSNDTASTTPNSGSSTQGSRPRGVLRLPLPPIDQALGAGAPNAANRQAAIHLPGATSDNCELTLIGDKEVLGDDVDLEPGPGAAAREHDALRYCLLQVQVGGKAEICYLSEPKAAPPAVVNLKSRSFTQQLAADLEVTDALASVVQLDVVPTGFPSHTLQSGQELRDNGIATIKMQQPDCVELEVRFSVERGRLTLKTEPYVTHRRMPKIRKRKLDAASFEVEEVRESLIPTQLARAGDEELSVLGKKQETIK